MKTTALDAFRESLRPYPGFTQSILTIRRNLGLRPLRRSSRLLDASMIGRIALGLDGIATVAYYGHPARRMAIAFPLNGVERDTLRQAVKESAACVSGSWSCGNYIFPLSQS